jgi:serine/threonine protein kinase
MPLNIGTRLGPYLIEAPVGAGGMGEVYRANDSRLGRDVAIKTSKRAFDERYQREARAIAALNHPNVCTLYDVGPDYLVMEYVDGQSLADRIAEGPLSKAEAIAIATQIAAALEAAHEKGIIHRDLKPANIRIKPDGQVKVLDFGLAKVVNGLDPSHASPSESPTFTGVGTSVGVILGTAAYMAPEQARSQAVDKRADIWAFGVVLWEMLTGRRLFPGDTASDSLAALLKEEPRWEDVPPRMRPLLRRCLEKDPRKRLHDIADARLWLEEPPPIDPAPSRSVSSSRRGAWMLAGSVASLAVAIGVILWRGPRPVFDERSIQFVVSAPAGTTMDALLGGTAVSPDERSIVFVASTTLTDSALYVHSLESGSTRQLPGTDHGDYPFWSPDSQSVAFIADGRLKRIEIAGGPPVDLGEAPATSAGDWDRGVILLGFRGGLWRIPDSGGPGEQITTLDASRGETYHGAPQFLSDGKRFLYYVTSPDTQKRGIYLGSLNGHNERQLVLATSNKARYAPALPGKPDALLYLREQTLLAQRFDVQKGTLTGEPSIIAEPITRGGGVSQNASFWIGQTGMLVYRKSDAETQRRLVWFARDGARVEQLPRENRYSSFYLSPDGKRLAVDVMDGNAVHDIWIYEFGRNTMNRQTSHPANDFLGVWSPDGQRLVFGSSRTGASQMYLTTVGGAAEEVITDGPLRKYPLQWTHDAKYVLFRGTNPDTSRDELWALAVDGDRKPFPVVQNSFSQFAGQISPDGKWIAYQSTLSGANEVYAQRFPVATGRVQLSNKGGRWPKWRGDGKELYFVSGNDTLIAVAVDPSADDLNAQPAKELFRAVLPGNLTYPYDVSSDGKRFLILERSGQQDIRLEVMTNWRSRMK